MFWALIRKLFMKGASLEEGVQAFIKANKGMTRSLVSEVKTLYEILST